MKLRRTLLGAGAALALGTIAFAGLETGTYISDLNSSNPLNTDLQSQGDDHIRLIKSTLQATFPDGSRAFQFETVVNATTTYAVATADDRAFILADATSGAFDVDLPALSGLYDGFTLWIMKIDGSANAVTIDGNAAETINGAATLALSTQYDVARIAADISVGWFAMDDTALATYLQNVVEDTTPQLGGQLDVNGQAIGDGTRELLTFTEDASAVNHVNIENEATGSGPIISSAGDNATVDLNISTKSTGVINLNAATNIVGTATVTDDIQHSGDTDNKIAFTTDAQSLETGGSSRLDISNSGVRLGGANARVTTIIDDDTMATAAATNIATAESIKAYVDASASSITSGTLKAATSGTTSEFTGLASGYKIIWISGRGLEPSAGTNNLELQLGTGGTPTWVSTGYTAMASYVGDTTNTLITDAFELTKTTTNNPVDFSLTMHHITGNKWMVHGVSHENNAGTSKQFAFSGYVSLGAEITAIRLQWSGGANFGGSVGEWNYSAQ